MGTLTVTAKRQERRILLAASSGVQPGEKVDVEKLPDGRIEVKAALIFRQDFGCLRFPEKGGGPTLSIEEINRIAADGWAGKR